MKIKHTVPWEGKDLLLETREGFPEKMKLWYEGIITNKHIEEGKVHLRQRKEHVKGSMLKDEVPLSKGKTMW